LAIAFPQNTNIARTVTVQHPQAFLRVAIACWLLAAPLGALAETLTGEVVGLSDGDTVTVLDASNSQHKVRLAGIDAPEKQQPFGDRARQNLASLVFRQPVTVEWEKTDRYGRLVGKVVVEGVDVGLAQVRAGLAWHYTAYAKEQALQDQKAYSEAEHGARADRRGLWQQPQPVAPWDFRKAKRLAGTGNAAAH
jgi:endonuclease YncB( thermonuclease family)